MTSARRRHLPPARRVVALLGALAALCGPAVTGAAPAFASDGGDDNGGADGRQEVRTTGSCDRGATARLRLRSRDGELRVNVEIDHARPRSSWRIVVVHDRRVVARARKRIGLSSSAEIERRLPDLPGADSVSARAWGPGGATCSVSATLPG